MTLVLKAEKQKSVLAFCSPLFTTLETRRKFGQVKLRKRLLELLLEAGRKKANWQLQEREGNWAELTFAKTSGTVTGDRVIGQ